MCGAFFSVTFTCVHVWHVFFCDVLVCMCGAISSVTFTCVHVWRDFFFDVHVCSCVARFFL